MPRVTEEQKKFISNLHLKEGKNAGEIIVAFEEQYGYSPSNKVINKWKYYEETPDDEPGTQTGKTGDVDPQTGDSRTVKDEVVSFTADEMADAPFLKMCKIHGKSHAEMAKLLRKAAQLGYSKVNVTTGVFSK